MKPRYFGPQILPRTLTIALSEPLLRRGGVQIFRYFNGSSAFAEDTNLFQG